MKVWLIDLNNILIFISLVFFISLNLLKVNHPVLLAAILILTAFFSSLILGKMLIRWLFYLLALVFLGGVMVVLLFIVSVCANEKFFYTSNFNGLILIPRLRLIYLITQPFIRLNTSFNRFNITLLLYQSDTALIFISLISILMLALIRVVIVRKMESGPLVKRL